MHNFVIKFQPPLIIYTPSPLFISFAPLQSLSIIPTLCLLQISFALAVGNIFISI